MQIVQAFLEFPDGFFMVDVIMKCTEPAARWKRRLLQALFLLALPLQSLGIKAEAQEPPQQCRRVTLRGHVQAGDDWVQPFGQGWVFRLIPIKPGDHGYSGWDLVVDLVGGAGFPDALLLATPPYESINQREIGTTFGLRAQDAIGWNPRKFRFLTNPPELRKAQRLYFEIRGGQNLDLLDHDKRERNAGKVQTQDKASAFQSLMELVEHSAAGQFRIVNAALTPGTANPLPYAQNWALQQRDTPHTITDTNRATPFGKLDSLEFEITLWLPADWKAPKGLENSLAGCR